MRRINARRLAHQLGRLTTLTLILGMLPVQDAVAARYGFEVIEAQLTHTGSTCVVNASLDYRFSKPVIQAMEHGVPLTLVIRFTLARHRHYWLDETILSRSRRLNISFHPLTQSYRIVYEDTGITENFATFTTLLEYLGSMRDWQIHTEQELIKNQPYTASLRVALDIEALPLPLRPVAYINPGWYLESPRYLWQIAG